jgi:hypothetical protein
VPVSLEQPAQALFDVSAARDAHHRNIEDNQSQLEIGDISCIASIRVVPRSVCVSIIRTEAHKGSDASIMKTDASVLKPPSAFLKLRLDSAKAIDGLGKPVELRIAGSDNPKSYLAGQASWL